MRKGQGPRVSLGPIVAAFSDQPYTVAVALQAQAVAVVFDFMKPVGTSRDQPSRLSVSKTRIWAWAEYRIFGPSLPVIGTLTPKAYCHRWPNTFLIFDRQTHYRRM